MYIERIVDKNIGPIKNLDLLPSFDSNGNPKPIIIVGENGSGKSTFVSNIVDSLFEVANKAYNGAVHSNENINGHSYFKVISSMQICTNESYLFSRIKFTNNLEYIFKIGNFSFEDFKKESGFDGSISDWNIEIGRKIIQGINKQEVEKLFESNVLCYFGPERYEKPSWMGDSYYDDVRTHLSIQQKYVGEFSNPILVSNVGKENLRWLLDLIVDSRTDIEEVSGSLRSVHVNINNLVAMSVARANVEAVMSLILGEEIYFGLNLRNNGGGRFNIRRKSDDQIIAPTLDSLSTGQLALFNMFSTIIRYADNNDISKSIRLSDIQGIVVVDEIELHLHSILQKEILPKLIKMFPKIQFIITTHAPLFLLGMNDEFGDNGFDIYQLPESRKINSECFSEFGRAYFYFTKTEQHQKELLNAISKTRTSDALVITEGSTDWKHMMAAYNELKQKEEYSAIFDNLNIAFFEYEPANSDVKAENKVEMGDKALLSMCQSFSKMKQNQKLIFIADRDNSSIVKHLSDGNLPYKSWGNNVYSFVLPVPEFRRDTPEICIEHLYKDEEIKTPFTDGSISRRLFIGKEFDDRGISAELQMHCAKKSVCGSDKINIIEGSSDERITSLFGETETNHALSKRKFAELVLTKAPGFDCFDFCNFLDIFKTIKLIFDHSKEDDS